MEPVTIQLTKKQVNKLGPLMGKLAEYNSEHPGSEKGLGILFGQVWPDKGIATFSFMPCEMGEAVNNILKGK